VLSRMLILGMYSYYTGEANVNTQIADFAMVFTAAHEMAHQRGIAREDEANFVAFLILSNSDSVFLQYSGYLSMLDYVLAALRRANRSYFDAVRGQLNRQARADLNAYHAFFTQFRDTTLANVSSNVNNAFLQSQGQSAGVRSYGLVVDLAVVYFRNRIEANG